MPTGPAIPRVSVLIPVYNAERYLREALDCMVRQTFTDFEVICVDDGSSDGSLDILNEYAARDSRFRIISRPNTGIVGALNDALAAAQGELIARMDGDDLCHDERFARQVEYLDNHPECDAVGTWITRCDPFGSPAGVQEPPVDHDSIDTGLLRGDASLMVHATLILRRSIVDRVGGWDSRFDWVEDLDLFLRLTEAGRVANIPEHLYTYRRHLESVCATKNDIMYERLTLVLREAYRRRGIAGDPDMRQLRPELNSARPTTGEQYRNWACHAIHHENRPIARRHALAALRHEPLKLQSWKVAYWAMVA